MTGAWVAFGFVIGAAGATVGVLPALGIVAASVAIAWGFARDERRPLVTSLLIVLGFALGLARYAVWEPTSDRVAEGQGKVLWIDDTSSLQRLVALRDDGRLVGLEVDGRLELLPGERIAWRGEYRVGRTRLAGVPVTGTYYVASEDVQRGQRESVLQSVRNWVRSTVLRGVPEPSGSLALGILTGDDRGLSRGTRQVLREAGLSHLTAVSGWNVAVVTAFADGLLSALRARRWIRSLAILTLVWGYAALTGLEPPVIRAAAMASLYVLARWRGWPREPLSALGWAVVLALIVRPELLASLAFQLSALATAALSVGRLLVAERSWGELIVLPVVVQAAVTPLLLARFGTYSLVAPLANVLVEPVVPWLLVAGLIALIGGVMPWLASVFGVPAWILGQWIVLVGDIAGRLPGGAGKSMAPPIEWIEWVYALAGAGTLAWIDRRATAP